MKKIEFICKVCGVLQQPVERKGSFDVFDPKCKCGGTLTVQIGKKK